MQLDYTSLRRTVERRLYFSFPEIEEPPSQSSYITGIWRQEFPIQFFILINAKKPAGAEIEKSYLFWRVYQLFKL